MKRTKELKENKEQVQKQSQEQETKYYKPKGQIFLERISSLLKAVIISILLYQLFLKQEDQVFDIKPKLQNADKIYKAVVLGATGAVGRELIVELCKSNKWSEITVIVRRELEEWKNIEGADKLKIIKQENLDILEDLEKWNIFQGYNAMFCCLGSRVKEGEDVFTKVDYKYPLLGAKIAKNNNIQHFSLVSSSGSSIDSWFLYMRTKGKIEEALKHLSLPIYSIFRPGILLNRNNDKRFGEKLFGYTPFFPKIETKHVALALRLESEQNLDVFNNQQKLLAYENDEIIEFLKQQL